MMPVNHQMHFLLTGGFLDVNPPGCGCKNAAGPERRNIKKREA